MTDLSAASMTFLARPKRRSFVSSQVVCKFIGTIFALTAIGLWIAPGASRAADVMLLKTGLTGILAMCAMAAFLYREKC